MRETVQLKAWGKVLSGWTQVEIVESLEALASTFSLSYSDRCLEADGLPRLTPGGACEVLIGDELVLAGYIDDSQASESADARTLEVSGLSRVGDLVDCSARRKPPQWSDATVVDIARDLVEPFGLDVVCTSGLDGPLKTFALEPGETVHEAIARAARLRGMILQARPSGALELAALGSRSAPAALERGRNIVSASRGQSMRDRFSEVRVLAQAGGEDLFGAEAAQASAAANDPSVKRYRPLDVLSDAGESSAGLAARAKWEVATRAGKASRMTVTVQDWTTPAGRWRPNALVRVKHDWLGVTGTLLIVTVRHTLDDGGRMTTLELCPPGAFEPEPVKPAKKEASWP